MLYFHISDYIYAGLVQFKVDLFLLFLTSNLRSGLHSAWLASRLEKSKPDQNYSTIKILRSSAKLNLHGVVNKDFARSLHDAKYCGVCKMRRTAQFLKDILISSMLILCGYIPIESSILMNKYVHALNINSEIYVYNSYHTICSEHRIVRRYFCH